MVSIQIQDDYNKEKVWVIKHSNCGHYYLNQKICGRFVNSRFIRVSLRYLNELFDKQYIENAFLLQMFDDDNLPF